MFVQRLVFANISGIIFLLKITKQCNPFYISQILKQLPQMGFHIKFVIQDYNQARHLLLFFLLPVIRHRQGCIQHYRRSPLPMIYFVNVCRADNTTIPPSPEPHCSSDGSARPYLHGHLAITGAEHYKGMCSTILLTAI